MEVSEFIVSAGRAVLELVEREWQPLSPAELEQRLDQAVEKILEAELMEKVKNQPPPPSTSTSTVYVQLQPNQTDVQTQVFQTTTCSAEEEDGTEERKESEQTSDSAAVQVHEHY